MRFALIAGFVLALLVGALAPLHGAAQQAPGSPPPAAQAGPPPLPSPKPGPDDAKLHKIAVQQFLAWQQGQVDRTLYTDDVNAQLNDEMMDRATSLLAHLGALQKVTYRGISQAKGVNVYVYHMACENGAVDMAFTLDPSGKIALIFFE